MTHRPEKSDLSTVATKLANKPGQPGAESAERRERAEGNTEGQHTRRTQSRVSVFQGLDCRLWNYLS
jgi:RNA-directed DNA polymerase